MSKREIAILSFMTFLFGVTLVVLCVLYTSKHEKQPKQTNKSIVVAKFSAPEFDKNAVNGEPQSVDNDSYKAFNLAEFMFKICGEPVATDEGAALWLTNLTDNPAWMRAEIYDTNQSLLGSGGIVKNGFYVQNIPTDKPLSAGQEIVVKVFFYEPDTYYSKGTFTLNLVCK